jgi:hypothetical protein
VNVIDPAIPATTQIHYIADPPARPRVWERFGLQNWSQVPLEPPRLIRSDSNDPDIDGYFLTPMTGGGLYQVRLYSDPSIDPNSQDPNNPEPRPDAAITIPFMLKSGMAQLITSQDQNAGGTWYRKTVATNKPTYFFLQVGNSPPFTDAEGTRRLFPVLGAGNQMLSAQHDLQLQPPLLAGNNFFALGLVVDETGKWQVFENTFVTKQRKVTLNFGTLNIINDGAVSGGNTAEFNIWVREGNNTIAHFFFGNVDNFDISGMPVIPLAGQGCTPVVIGPKQITSNNHDVGILVRGLCAHTVALNEPSANYFPSSHFPDGLPTPEKDKFPFTTGSAESVSGVAFVVKARPEITGNKFAFDVTATVTVEYN